MVLKENKMKITIEIDNSVISPDKDFLIREAVEQIKKIRQSGCCPGAGSVIKLEGKKVGVWYLDDNKEKKSYKKES
jgi:hypothetical protein